MGFNSGFKGLIHAVPLWPSKAANYRKGRIAVNIQYFRTLNIGYLKANAEAVSLSSVHLIRNIHLFSFKTFSLQVSQVKYLH